MADAASKVALITGAARGIGLAITEKFLAAGYLVAMLDRDEVTLAATASKLDRPNAVLPLICDVSQHNQVQSAVSGAVDRFGRIDALINNAGIAVFKPILHTTAEDWNDVIATNLTGPFFCTQACAPVMLRTADGAGSIVNIASISGLRASTLRVAYGTSKAALIHLTKQQAVELGSLGIRVNCIAPGPVETEMAKLVHSADIRTSYQDAIPLNRYGTVDEIANCVLFLCRESASYINGQTIAVDGGFDAAGVGLPSLRQSS
jgi:meso-butanediol dehydrogenase/(S,S)-butanediol dehydrogenase/diacetyl reductase